MLTVCRVLIYIYTTVTSFSPTLPHWQGLSLRPHLHRCLRPQCATGDT